MRGKEKKRMVIPDNCLLYVDASGYPGHDGGEVPYFDGTEESGADSGNGRYAVFRDGWETGYTGTDEDWAELKLSDVLLMTERAVAASMAPGCRATAADASGLFKLRLHHDFADSATTSGGGYVPLSAVLSGNVFGHAAQVYGFGNSEITVGGQAHNSILGLFSSRDLTQAGVYFDRKHGNLHEPRRLRWSVTQDISWESSRIHDGGADPETNHRVDESRPKESFDGIWRCGGLSDSTFEFTPDDAATDEGSDAPTTLRLQLALAVLPGEIGHSLVGVPDGGSVTRVALSTTTVEESDGVGLLVGDTALDTSSAFGGSTPWESLGFHNRRRPQDGDTEAGPLRVAEPEGTVRHSLYLTQPVEETLEQARRILEEAKDFVTRPAGVALDCTEGVLEVSGVPEVMGSDGDDGFAPAQMTWTERSYIGDTTELVAVATFDENTRTWSDFEYQEDQLNTVDGSSSETVTTTNETLIGQDGPYRAFVDDRDSNTTGSVSPGRRLYGGLAPVMLQGQAPHPSHVAVNLAVSVRYRGVRRVSTYKYVSGGKPTYTIDVDADDNNKLILREYIGYQERKTELVSSYNLGSGVNGSGDTILVSGVVPEGGEGPLRLCLMSHFDTVDDPASSEAFPETTVGRCDTTKVFGGNTLTGSYSQTFSSCEGEPDTYDSYGPWQESSGWSVLDGESDSWYSDGLWEESWSEGDGDFDRDEPWWDAADNPSTEETPGGHGGVPTMSDVDDCGPGWPAAPLLDNRGLGRHVENKGTAIVSYAVTWQRTNVVTTDRDSYGSDAPDVPASPNEVTPEPPSYSHTESYQTGKTNVGVAVVTRSYPWHWDSGLRCGVFEHPPMDKDFAKSVADQAGLESSAFRPPADPPTPQVVLGDGDSSTDGSTSVENDSSLTLMVQMLSVVATGSLGSWPGD